MTRSRAREEPASRRRARRLAPPQREGPRQGLVQGGGPYGHWPAIVDSERASEPDCLAVVPVIARCSQRVHALLSPAPRLERTRVNVLSEDFRP